MKLKILVLFCGLALGGCLYQGRDFSTVSVKDIQVNTTTQRDIFNNFGEPERRGLENG